MKGKNKLVPRLLGVTKDSVLRLDERTKETLQTWPLTTVRRWCASPNTFTLDFGDYRYVTGHRSLLGLQRDKSQLAPLLEKYLYNIYK